MSMRIPLKQFLLLGEDDVDIDRITQISLIASKSIEYLHKWEKTKTNFHQKASRCSEYQAQIATALKSNCEAIQSLQRYSSVQLEIRLIGLLHSFETLLVLFTTDDFDDTDTRYWYQEVSNSIESINYYRAHFMPTNLSLFHYIKARLGMIQVAQLQRFHSVMETLVETRSLDSVSSSIEEKDIMHGSRTLFSYLLLSLLPSALCDGCTKFPGEIFQRALDSAFSPVWSRFQFHLNLSRESGNYDEILWTFCYASSFQSFLSSICKCMSTQHVLQLLYPTNYNAECMEAISVKLTRFMRAHVAIVLSTQRLSDAVSANLIESCLDLDSNILRERSGESENCNKRISFTTIKNGAESVFGVITDCRVVHSRWLLLEFAYFSDSIAQTLCGSHGGYSLEHDLYSFENNRIVGGGCYPALFECGRLFVLACKRYRYLPSLSQDMVAEIIIERLLAFAVGICLLRIRSCPMLQSLSGSSVTFPLGSNPKQQIRQELMRFTHSCQLFIEMISSVESGIQISECIINANADRYLDHCWRQLNEWIPKTVTDDSAYNLVSMHRYIWKRSIIERAAYCYDERPLGLVTDLIHNQNTAENPIELVVSQLHAMQSVLESNYSVLLAN